MFKDIQSSKRAFWALIIGFILSVFITLLNNFFSISINNYATVLEGASINIALDKKVDEESFLVCFNDICKNPQTDKFKNMYYLGYAPGSFDNDFYSDTLKNIYIVQKKDAGILNLINEIYLYVGNNSYYYNKNDIKNFHKKTIQIKLDNSSKNESYDSIQIKNEFKTNYKGILNHICCMFLFIFYVWNKFLISFLMLIGAVIVYNRANLKYNFFYPALAIICLMAIIFRLNLLTYNPLWIDEIYTKIIAISSFSHCFKDPGNPPLFYILEFISSKIFSNSIVVLRSVSFVIGCLLIPAMYLLLRQYGKKITLLGTFMASFNIIYIYHSQEIRSCGLCMLLTILSIYFLFNYIEKPQLKNLILYGFVSALAINTHYYLAFFIFANYLYGLFILGKGNKIKFTISNAISALTLMPYLMISFKRASDATFNTWIGVFDIHKIIYTINDYFCNKYIFLIVVILVLVSLFCIFSKKIKTDDKLNKLFIYICYSILAVFLIICFVSLTVKPVFHKRLWLSLYSLLLMLEILLISFTFYIRNIFLKTSLFFVLLLGYFSITHPMNLNKICRIDEYINYINSDCVKYIEQGYEVHAVLTDYIEYLAHYPKILDKKIIWHLVSGNSGKYVTKVDKDYISKSPKVVVYLNSIGAEFKYAVEGKSNAYMVHTNSISNAKIIYDK